MSYAGEGRLEVSVDIVRQGLERRDVEEAAAVRLFWNRLGEEPVESPEECGEGLAGARGGVDQGVLP